MTRLSLGRPVDDKQKWAFFVGGRDDRGIELR
jgi:hypothetical protein